MAKPQNQWEELARDAAARLDRARAAGEQLTFLDDEPRPGGAVAVQGDGAGDSGSGKRGKSRVSSQMRDWLEHRGYRMPEDMLVQMAGLASREDAILVAMQHAERVLTWAYDAGDDPIRSQKRPSEAERLDVFMKLYTIQLRAAEALLPYGAPKATPDMVVNQQTTLIVPVGPSRSVDRAGAARDVTPRPGSRMAPPPLPHENKQNQQVSGVSDGASDDDSRTE